MSMNNCETSKFTIDIVIRENKNKKCGSYVIDIKNHSIEITCVDEKAVYTALQCLNKEMLKIKVHI